jgi:hypothetical protein
MPYNHKTIFMASGTIKVRDGVAGLSRLVGAERRTLAGVSRSRNRL